MMNKKNFFFSLIFLCSGCATQPPAPPPPDPALVTLAKAVEQIREERRLLTDTLRRKNPPPPPPNIPNYPEFHTEVTLINWTGPAQSAAKWLAQQMNYELRFSGKPNGTDPIVHLNGNAVPVYVLLTEFADQGEKVFDIRIDPQLRQMTLIYK